MSFANTTCPQINSKNSFVSNEQTWLTCIFNGFIAFQNFESNPDRPLVSLTEILIKFLEERCKSVELLKRKLAATVARISVTRHTNRISNGRFLALIRIKVSTIMTKIKLKKQIVMKT